MSKYRYPIDNDQFQKIREQAIPYEADGRKVTKCGVGISSEQRNITHWRMIDAEGNVIEDKVYLNT